MKIQAILAISSILLTQYAYTAPISEKIGIYTKPAIVGLWGMSTANNKKCIEYYNFKSNKDVLIKSGAEWSYGQYDYQPALDTNLPAILILNIRYDNNQEDCSGVKEDQSGEITRFAVVWKTPAKIEFCDEEQLTDCFASLKRIQP